MINRKEIKKLARCYSFNAKQIIQNLLFAVLFLVMPLILLMISLLFVPNFGDLWLMGIALVAVVIVQGIISLHNIALYTKAMLHIDNNCDYVTILDLLRYNKDLIKNSFSNLLFEFFQWLLNTLLALLLVGVKLVDNKFLTIAFSISLLIIRIFMAIKFYFVPGIIVVNNSSNLIDNIKQSWEIMNLKNTWHIIKFEISLIPLEIILFVFAYIIETYPNMLTIAITGIIAGIYVSILLAYISTCKIIYLYKLAQEDNNDTNNLYI